jgi:hypothetical protein
MNYLGHLDYILRLFTALWIKESFPNGSRRNKVIFIV